jgi:hypothetical protein
MPATLPAGATGPVTCPHLRAAARSGAMLPPDRSGVIPPLGRVGVIGAGGESGGAARYSVGMEIRSMTAAARAASSPVAAA